MKVLFALLVFLNSAGTLVSTETLFSGKEIRILGLRDDRNVLAWDQNNEQLTIKAAGSVNGQGFHPYGGLRSRKARSSIGQVLPVGVGVTQEKNYRVVRWQTNARNLGIRNYKIYRSFSNYRVLGVNNMEEVALVSGSTTEWQDNCTTHHSIVRYAVTAVDSNGREHTLGAMPTSPLTLFGSFEPIAPLQNIVSPFVQCCVLCSDVAFNPDSQQYLYVYDCDGNGDGLADSVHAVLLDSGGRASNPVDLTATVTAPFVQGCPCAAYNPSNREYLVVFEVKTPQLFNNEFFLVSQRLNSRNLLKLSSPTAALRRSSQGGIRQCKVTYNPKTTGFAVVGEAYSPVRHTECAMGYIAANGATVAAEIIRMPAASLQPSVVYDENTESLVVVFLGDRSACRHDKHLCSNVSTEKDFIGFIRRSSIPKQPLSNEIRRSVVVVGYTAVKKPRLDTFLQSGKTSQCIGVCYDVDKSSGHSTTVECSTHCSDTTRNDWNKIQNPLFCSCGQSSMSSGSLAYRSDKATFLAVWEDRTANGQRLNGHFLNPAHFVQGNQWTDQHSPNVVYNAKSDSFCVFWTYSSGCSSCYKSAVRCFTPSTKCTDPCCCSDLPTCEFPCSSCDANADCRPEKRSCVCSRGYVGDGGFCCPKGLGTKTAVLGSSTVFKCGDSCSLPKDSQVKWYHNGKLLTLQSRSVSFSTDGRWLSVEPVGISSQGNYTCEIHTKLSVYQRRGSLRVLGRQDVSYQCGYDCGRSCAPLARIHLGTTVPLGKYPWMGMLCDQNSGVFCGAVLVSCQCVVTSAHCVLSQQGKTRDPSKFSICFNKRCRNQCEVPDYGKSNDCFRAKEIIVHPQYDNDTFDNDIAVIKLERSVENNCSTVSPVCLPYGTDNDQDAVHPGANAVVIGWGEKRPGGRVARCLQEGNVRIVTTGKCRQYHQNSQFTVTGNTLCATDENGACQGDSGGPLLVQDADNENRWTLAGIVSWGIGCGQKDSYGAYANVPRLAGFVRGACGTI